jgi:hypothetical protein
VSRRVMMVMVAIIIIIIIIMGDAESRFGHW